LPADVSSAVPDPAASAVVELTAPDSADPVAHTWDCPTTEELAAVAPLAGRLEPEELAPSDVVEAGAGFCPESDTASTREFIPEPD
jgi:hypothetical protein